MHEFRKRTYSQMNIDYIPLDSSECDSPHSKRVKILSSNDLEQSTQQIKNSEYSQRTIINNGRSNEIPWKISLHKELDEVYLDRIIEYAFRKSVVFFICFFSFFLLKIKLFFLFSLIFLFLNKIKRNNKNHNFI